MVGVLALFAIGDEADARTGTYGLAILRTSYSNASNHLWTLNQFNQAAREIHDYFDRLSYGKLDMQVRVADVSLSNTREFYWDDCAASGEKRDPCPPPLVEDAAEIAAKNGFSFNGIDGIVVVSPFAQGDYTSGPIQISEDDVSGTFQRSYDFESALPAVQTPPGSSTVAWNGWAHEIGHQLQFDQGTSLDGKWNGHPSGYASGYELMDSCYPCDESLYGLSGPPVSTSQKQVFPEFLDPGFVRTVNAPDPNQGTRSETITLLPLGLQPGQAGYGGTKAIKIPIITPQGGLSGQQYLEVTGRSNVGADAFGSSPGLWDQGVRIRFVDEWNDPPVINVESCDFTVPGGCSRGDSRKSLCTRNPPPLHRGDIPDFCYPYPLWHAGESYTDAGRHITVRVDQELFSPFPVRSGFVVTVIRGPVDANAPDVYVTPSHTPPLFTFESTDLWIDSSCNGYEHDFVSSGPRRGSDDGVGVAGLRYGRRDVVGTVVGNGDDVCFDHPNRIYVQVRNVGNQPARNLVVHVKAQLLPGASVPGIDFGILGSVAGSDFFPPQEIGTATIASLDPGQTTDAYVTWTPSSAGYNVPYGRTQIPIGLQADVDPVAGETVTGNQHTDEMINYFELTARTLHAFLGVTNFGGISRILSLTSPGSFCDGCYLRIAGRQQDFSLRGGEVRLLPLDIELPSDATPGETEYLPVTMGTQTFLENPAIPDYWPAPETHEAYTTIGGAALAVNPVLPSALTLSATRQGRSTVVTGQLTPQAKRFVTIDLIDGKGGTSQTVETNTDGRFQAIFEQVPWSGFDVHALWIGDQTHARASSPTVHVEEERPGKGCGDPNHDHARLPECK